MFNWIDNFLNRITMYRLVLYVLIVFWAVALIFNFTGVLHYDPLAMLAEAGVILAVCWVLNRLFAKIWSVPANVESIYITALILMLIISPAVLTAGYVGFLTLASAAAMLSKFLLAINRKHIFNPAAFGVALTAFILGGYASWWIGTAAMLPVVAVGEFLIVRKIIRWDLVLTFLGAALLTTGVFAMLRGSDPVNIIQRTIVDSPLIFFAVIMLTEPLTSPPRRPLRILYGAAVGILFVPEIHLGGLYFTPELALLAGNILSYALSPKFRLRLKLVEKRELGPDLYDFAFAPSRKIDFRPGQYMEWTLGHAKSDSRGNRRYFTVASSPTESTVHIGVRFNSPASSFKRALTSLKVGDVVFGGQLAGDFTLPTDIKKKLVLIAGGIGVTPYRSMAKYLTDKREQCDIIMLYSAKTPDEFSYREIFEAARGIGWRSVYSASDLDGYLTADRIKQEVPDHKDRMFYISGPRSMVVSFEEILQKLGIPRSHIKTDFFPGFV